MLKISDFYFDKQKSFIPKKILSVPCTMDSTFFSQQMAPWCPNFPHQRLWFRLLWNFLYILFVTSNHQTTNLIFPNFCTNFSQLSSWKRKQTFHKFWNNKKFFSNISCMFLNPNNFSNMKSNCSDLLDMRKLQEQDKKVFCSKKFFCTVWINCYSDLKNFANSLPSALNFKSFSRSLEYFFSHSRLKQFWYKIPVFFFNC